MNKLILPVILGVFVLFFSGKSITNKNCGPTVNIICPGGTNNTMTEVRVTNGAGQTTVYTNPSFPITYYGSGGGLFTVAVFFSSRDHFCIWSWVESNGDECNEVNYHNSPAGSLQFNANCNEYLVSILGLYPDENGYCP